MAQRSLLRPDQLDSNGSYNFAQLVIDGYSGGDLQDGYLMGLVLTDGYEGGSETVRIDAHDGAINQVGTGQVTFNGNVQANQNVTIEGDLTVRGTTTSIETDQMVVTDPITVINATGTEALDDWTGFTARDTDGYNRIGWVFEEGGVDGYWAVSSVYNADPDAVPNHALAFLGDGYTNGDLSSTDDGDSGADKIGITAIDGINADNVQIALEALDDNIDINAGNIATNASNIATNASNIATNASNIATNASNIAQNAADIDALEQGTTYNQWTLNTDATAGSDEDACFIMSGGDGANLVDGYFCVITDSVGGDRFQMQLYEGGAKQSTDLHLGTASETASADATLTFNAGNGVDAYQASISLDGNSSDQGDLIYTAVDHLFTGDILPSADCTYQLGDESHRFLDAYFCLFTPANYTPVGSNSSLEGHLKGLDNAITGGGVALQPERGVYYITNAEATADTLDSSRAVDQGTAVDVSGWTDADFRDYAWIYWNGQLLVNDPTPAANQGAVQNDVARETGTLQNLIFAGDLKKNAVIQIVDFR